MLFKPAKPSRAELSRARPSRTEPNNQANHKEFQNFYMNRSIIREFLRDGAIGKKRLISMPDRNTNTINLAGGQRSFRPTVDNCYGRHFDLQDPVEDWWGKWNSFMFSAELELHVARKVRPYDLVTPISRTKSEARVSFIPVTDTIIWFT